MISDNKSILPGSGVAEETSSVSLNSILISSDSTNSVVAEEVASWNESCAPTNSGVQREKTRKTAGWTWRLFVVRIE
jgi:hypothetical protein